MSSLSDRSLCKIHVYCLDSVKESKRRVSSALSEISTRTTSFTRSILRNLGFGSEYGLDGRLRRPRIVILGTGWGFMKLALGLDVCSNDVTVISPNKFFCFTPLLTQIVSNKIPKEVCEVPLSELTYRGNKEMIKHIRGLALDIDKDKKQVIYLDSERNKEERISYDYLIINVGNDNSNIVPGVMENALYLRDVKDSLKMRDAVVNRIKEVNKGWDTMSEEKKREKLTFVVAGGGPTGIEVSGAFAELTEGFLSRAEYKKLAPYINIRIIEMANKLLPTAEDKVSEYVKFVLSSKAGIDVMLETRLLSVSKDTLVVKRNNGTEEIIPYGVLVWASGASPNALTKQICENVSEQSTFKRAIVVNQRLQVYGVPNAYALGDCAFVMATKLAERSREIYRDALASPYGPTVGYIKDKLSTKEFPQVLNLSKVQDLPKKDAILTEEQIKEVLGKLDSLYLPPPPTAQGASQQGEYLVKVFNENRSEKEKQSCPAFIYDWAGTACYIYNNNIAFYTPSGSMLGGFHTQFIWRMFYTSLIPSWKNRYTLSKRWFNPFGGLFSGHVEDIYS
ncbi:type II NADH:ubiquinone oxidoreductase [Cryptosporidium felis]|nr:type II NADH:ubiquinone oxidoreductase [Cryptosporidium felis]